MKYALSQRLLHWIIALMVLGALAVMEHALAVRQHRRCKQTFQILERQHALDTMTCRSHSKEMVRACRQPLTSTPDDMDAFTLMMLAVEVERKKRQELSALEKKETTCQEQENRELFPMVRNDVAPSCAPRAPPG